jgi:hypothetical protein
MASADMYITGLQVGGHRCISVGYLESSETCMEHADQGKEEKKKRKESKVKENKDQS